MEDEYFEYVNTLYPPCCDYDDDWDELRAIAAAEEKTRKDDTFWTMISKLVPFF